MESLKIAMLVRQFSPLGGLELYTHKLVEGLLERNVQVTVVCQEKASDLEHPLLKYKGIAKESSVSGKRNKLLDLYKKANQALAELDSIDLVHSQHCPTDSADLVTLHNHSSKRLSEVGLWWEKSLNECKRNFVPAYKLRDFQDETLLRRAYCLIFPALVMKEDFFRAYPFLQGPPAKPYVLVHPGASLLSAKTASDEEVLSREERRAAGDVAEKKPFTFLFVGRGFRKKGLDILLSACVILKERGAAFRLLIAGLSAKPADSLRLNLLGLKNHVFYLGFQKDMDAVYRQAQSIILPSRVEPFGMAPVQGMQRGLVPIVSRVSGVSEILSHELDSLILGNHLSALELANLMNRLMSDEFLLKRLSENAVLTAEKVSWQETVDNTMKAYEIALGLKKTGKSTQPV